MDESTVNATVVSVFMVVILSCRRNPGEVYTASGGTTYGRAGGHRAGEDCARLLTLDSPRMPATVCVIDDDASIRTSLLRLSRACGYPAQEYSSAGAGRLRPKSHFLFGAISLRIPV